MEEITRFLVRIQALKATLPQRTIIPAYLALGGFTEDAMALCEENGVGTAQGLEYVQKDWSF